MATPSSAVTPPEYKYGGGTTHPSASPSEFRCGVCNLVTPRSHQIINKSTLFTNRLVFWSWVLADGPFYRALCGYYSSLLKATPQNVEEGDEEAHEEEPASKGEGGSHVNKQNRALIFALLLLIHHAFVRHPHPRLPLRPCSIIQGKHPFQTRCTFERGPST